MFASLIRGSITAWTTGTSIFIKTSVPSSSDIDTTHLLAALLGTELAGTLAMLYEMLLHIASYLLYYCQHHRET